MAADIFTVDLKNDQNVSASMRHECAREVFWWGWEESGREGHVHEKECQCRIKTLPMHISRVVCDNNVPYRVHREQCRRVHAPQRPPIILLGRGRREVGVS